MWIHIAGNEIVNLNRYKLLDVQECIVENCWLIVASNDVVDQKPLTIFDSKDDANAVLKWILKCLDEPDRKVIYLTRYIDIKEREKHERQSILNHLP